MLLPPFGKLAFYFLKSLSNLYGLIKAEISYLLLLLIFLEYSYSRMLLTLWKFCANIIELVLVAVVAEAVVIEIKIEVVISIGQHSNVLPQEGLSFLPPEVILRQWLDSPWHVMEENLLDGTSTIWSLKFFPSLSLCIFVIIKSLYAFSGLLAIYCSQYHRKQGHNVK